MRIIHDLACWAFFTLMLAAASLVAAVWSLLDLVLEPRWRE